MNKILTVTLLTSLSFLVSSCSTFSTNEAGTHAIRIVEVVGDGEVDAGTITQRAEVQGEVSSCRIETTSEPIEGTLEVSFQGNKCEVVYLR